MRINCIGALFLHSKIIFVVSYVTVKIKIRNIAQYIYLVLRHLIQPWLAIGKNRDGNYYLDAVKASSVNDSNCYIDSEGRSWAIV